MDRYDFQNLAKLRVREAGVLLENRCFEGAYYLSGYAVECAFKACIARRIRRFEFPDRKLVDSSYTHDLVQLLGVSGLRDEHERHSKANPNFLNNWLVVKDWSVGARYATVIPEKLAGDMYAAVTTRKDGVLVWLKKWW